MTSWSSSMWPASRLWVRIWSVPSVTVGSDLSLYTPDMPTLSLTKHHGAGNDFLVLIDVAGVTPLGPDLVRALCDRRFRSEPVHAGYAHLVLDQASRRRQ